MNVNDVKEVPMPMSQATALSDMFLRQSALEAKYCVIEGRPLHVGLNSRDGQVHIKDLLWRITEEVGEALEAEDKLETNDKVYEEFADAMHFFLSLYVTLNIGDKWLSTSRRFFSEAVMKDDGRDAKLGTVYDFVRDIGMLGNTLKLKPWKQTDVITDEIYFRYCLDRVTWSFLQLVGSRQMGLEQLFQFYMRKSAVNLFRIETKY